MALTESAFLGLVTFWGSIGVLICIAAGVWNIIAVFLHHRTRIGKRMKQAGGILSSDITPSAEGAKKAFPTVAKAANKLKDLFKREQGVKTEERAAEQVEGAGEHVEAELGQAEAGEEAEEEQSDRAEQTEGQYRERLSRLLEFLRNLAREDERLKLARQGASPEEIARIDPRLVQIEQEMQAYWQSLSEGLNRMRQAGNAGDAAERDAAGVVVAEMNLINGAIANTQKERKLIETAEKISVTEERDANQIATTAPTKRERADASKLLRLIEARRQHQMQLDRELVAKEKVLEKYMANLETAKAAMAEILKTIKFARAYLPRFDQLHGELIRLERLQQEKGVVEAAKIDDIYKEMAAINEKISLAKAKEAGIREARRRLKVRRMQEYLPGLRSLDTKIKEMQVKIRQLDKVIRSQAVREQTDMNVGR